MSPDWLWIALASAATAGVVGVIDSHFVTRLMPSLRAYLLIIGVTTAILSVMGLFLFPFPAGLPRSIVPVAIGAAVIRTGGVILLLYVLQKQDVARVIPLNGLTPVFVAVLALIFLGERLAPVQWGALLLAVGGAVLISFKQAGGATRFQTQAFWLMLFSSLMFGASDVITKYTLTWLSFWNNASISFLVTAVIITVFSLRRTVIVEIAHLNARALTVVAATANQLLAMLSMVLAFWAIQKNAVALVSTTLSSRPLFVLIYTLLLGRLLPGFVPDNLTEKRDVIRKAIATLMIVVAIALIFLS